MPDRYQSRRSRRLNRARGPDDQAERRPLRRIRGWAEDVVDWRQVVAAVAALATVVALAVTVPVWVTVLVGTSALWLGVVRRARSKVAVGMLASLLVIVPTLVTALATDH